MIKLKILIPILCVGFVLSLILSPCIAAKKSAERANDQEPIYIPEEVKTVLQEGLAAWQGRQDIPFTIIKYLCFPA